MRKESRVVLWAVCVVLLFLAAFSFFSVDDSFARYRKSRKDLSQANFEREQVQELITDSEEDAVKRQYTVDGAEVIEKGAFRSIEIRGGVSPSEEDGLYYPGTENFNVIEY